MKTLGLSRFNSLAAAPPAASFAPRNAFSGKPRNTSGSLRPSLGHWTTVASAALRRSLHNP
jgi:hypothetical protein